MSEVEVKPNNNTLKKKTVIRKRAAGTEIVGVPTVPTRRRRLTSTVWDHFTRIQDEEGTWARCDHCKKRFTGGSRSGTTHLRKHVAACLAFRPDKKKVLDIAQPILRIVEKNKDVVLAIENVKKDGIARVENYQFDQELSCHDLARMIILHEYPFSIVEHAGFRAYIKSLQPMFKFVSSSAIKEDCMAIFESEKQKLYEVMNKLQCRVSFTIDMSISANTRRYLCLTCHYVDEDWKLQKKLLKFCDIKAPQKNDDIAEAISTALCDWNLDQKLFSIVLDNCATNDVIVQELFKILSMKESVPGDVFYLCCYAYSLNLIVQDGLDSISEVLQKVRESIKYFGSSGERQKEFQNLAEQLNVPQNSLVLDVPMRWHSTFIMLEIALKCKDVFARMAEVDGDFKNCPSSEQWEMLKLVLECLKTFYDATEVFCGPKLPTANLYFGIICELYLALKDWCVSPHPSIAFMASKMKKQFQSYWDITHQVLAVSAVLDPQQKMKPIELYFPMIFDANEAKQNIKNVSMTLTRLFDDYSIRSARSEDSQGLLCYVDNNTGNAAAGGGPVGADGSSHIQWTNRLKRLDKFLQESSSSQSAKTELDMYLEEINYPVKDGLGVDFDILSWWKLNAPKYPILAQMARDILAIPISTVVSKGAFNAGGRVADQYRNSFHLKTAKNLLYAQDWLRSELEGQSIDGTLETLSSIFSIDVDDNKCYTLASSAE